MFFPPWWITHLGNVFFVFSKQTDTRTLNQIFQNVDLPANSQLVHFKLQNTSPAARASTMVLASLVGVYVEDRIWMFFDVFMCLVDPYNSCVCLSGDVLLAAMWNHHWTTMFLNLFPSVLSKPKWCNPGSQPPFEKWWTSFGHGKTLP